MCDCNWVDKLADRSQPAQESFPADFVFLFYLNTFLRFCDHVSVSECKNSSLVCVEYKGLSLRWIYTSLYPQGGALKQLHTRCSVSTTTATKVWKHMKLFVSNSFPRDKEASRSTAAQSASSTYSYFIHPNLLQDYFTSLWGTIFFLICELSFLVCRLNCQQVAARPVQQQSQRRMDVTVVFRTHLQLWKTEERKAKAWTCFSSVMSHRVTPLPSLSWCWAQKKKTKKQSSRSTNSTRTLRSTYCHFTLILSALHADREEADSRLSLQLDFILLNFGARRQRDTPSVIAPPPAVTLCPHPHAPGTGAFNTKIWRHTWSTRKEITHRF